MSLNGKKYKVGIIGCGTIASTIQNPEYPGNILFPYSHAGAYQAVPDTEVVAAADVDENKLKAFSIKWGVNSTYLDYRDMLAREDLDIVSICTPRQMHCKMTVKAAQSGVKAIFCEKPMAISLQEADRMLDACASNNVRLTIDNLRRWNPYYNRAQNLIRRGEIGNVTTIVAHGKGAMLELGSHLFDIIRFFANSDPKWVFGHAEDDSNLNSGCMGTIVFKNDIETLVNERSDHPIFFELEIIGSAGLIRIGNFWRELWKTNPDSRYRELVQHPFPGSLEAKAPMVLAVEEIIESIETGKETRSSGWDGRMALEVAVAFQQSGKLRRWVEFPL